MHHLRLMFVFGLLAASLASAAERPNILFAISDDQSYPHASAYGDKAVNTPAFDRIASEGVLFTNAFVASPGCSPSRAAFLTGRYPWMIEHAGTHASAFPQKYVVFPDLLEQAGYHVGYTGKGWGPGNFKASGRERNPAGNTYSKIRSKPPHKGIRNTDYAANFAEFLQDKPKDKPFYFWYGASEPHRGFEQGVGLKVGKKIADVDVPEFLPDAEEVRSDILDYCVEIEWFDKHLGQMLEMLEEAGELNNTIVIATSDNGMAFPRAKANCYEYGIHVPLAIRWADKVKGGRTIKDVVSLIDITPTILEAAGVEHPGDPPTAGRSILGALTSDKEGLIDADRRVYASRERHSSSRWSNWTYPQRALRTQKYLYIRNFKPERWPAGAPQKFNGDKLGPMHGGYHDIDACPTLTYLIQNRNDEAVSKYFHWAVDKRPAEELFDIQQDPACLHNLAADSQHAETLAALRKECEAYLRKTGDPRVTGNGDVWESYKRYSHIRKFPEPDLKQRVAPE